MVRRFNLTREDFKAVQDWSRWNLFLRKFEIDKMLDGFPKEHFDKALELGCGSGKHSKHLAYYCKKLIAIEYNENRLTEHSDEKTTFLTGDAQDLSQFSNNEMDMIFSSNLIEHLPNPGRCMAECRRVIKQEGLIIHAVPNRLWKIFHLLLYYPLGIKIILRRTFSADKSADIGEFIAAEAKLNSNMRPLDYSLKKNLLPKPHGISKSHISEFKNWGEKHWINIFEKNGLEVVNIVRLPFYSGWDYNFRSILRLGNCLGLSSSTGFILRKTMKQ